MKLEYYPLDKLKKEILEIIGHHLDIDKYDVFFFGSRVVGKGTDRSDIDVGIEGYTAVPTEALLAIQEEIEQLPTLYKIEIVDFCRTVPQFRQVAKERIEIIK